MTKEIKKIIIYTDGGSRGNPGPAGVGVVIADAKGGVIKEYSKDIGERTNNEAEYEAVILALQKVKHLFGKEKAKKMEIEMRMDSQLVARQLGGKYKIQEEKLFPLFIKIWNLRIELGKISFTEIPREKNKEADRLANEAMNKKETKKMF
ncbi:MAG: ribonuclease HI family protein [bacterium]|nr:ribonuclease HI family protein [bacterium]